MLSKIKKFKVTCHVAQNCIHPSIHPQMLNRNLWRTFQILWEVLCQVYHKPGTYHPNSVALTGWEADAVSHVWVLSGFLLRVQVHTICLHAKGGWKYQTKLLANVYIWKAHQGEHRKRGVTPHYFCTVSGFDTKYVFMCCFVSSIVHLGKLSLTL